VRDGTPLADDDLPPKGDDRFQFAAACCELVQALEVGPDFVTRLPITVDGCCSGLQHLAAVTRSEEAARYVNLIPSEDGDDFYLRVAEKVWYENLPPMMQGPDDRKLVKKPCVQYFYGSKAGGFNKNFEPYSMTAAVDEVFEERDLPSEGADQIAQAIEAAIEDLASCAKEVRVFLEGLVKLYAKHGKQFRWTTPLGMPCLNFYNKPDVKQIAVWVNGRRRRVSWTVGDTDKPRKKKPVQAVSPNFVHSVDATHLHMVALAAEAEDIPLVAVHDSFGTTAPRMRRLNRIIREQFMKLHKHDLLGEVLEQARRDLPKSASLPPLPQKGNLDLSAVLRSFDAFK
jgi:DNA-directed RNA polymerase